MENREKIDRILSYLELQISIPISKLKNKPIKSKNQFLKNYNQHDKATKVISLTYFQNNFSLHPIGKDLRFESVLIKNEVPDYYVEKIIDTKNIISFCFDVKSKSKKDYFGWINKRSIEDYQRFSQYCDVDVYIIFIIIEKNQIIRDFAYSNVFNDEIDHTIAWDKNEVLIFPYNEGLPFINRNPNSLSL